MDHLCFVFEDFFRPLLTRGILIFFTFRIACWEIVSIIVIQGFKTLLFFHKKIEKEKTQIQLLTNLKKNLSH